MSMHPSATASHIDALCAKGLPDRQDLQCWFGLSYASFCVLPRVLMEAMPDEWQNQIGELLNQYSASWDTGHLPTPYITAKQGNKFASWPDWVLNYRHPNREEIESVRIAAAPATGGE